MLIASAPDVLHNWQKNPLICHPFSNDLIFCECWNMFYSKFWTAKTLHRFKINEAIYISYKQTKRWMLSLMFWLLSFIHINNWNKDDNETIYHFETLISWPKKIFLHFNSSKNNYSEFDCKRLIVELWF